VGATVLGGLWALEHSFGRFVGVRTLFYLASKLLEFLFIIASKLYQLQIWAVCGRKSGRFRGLWALKWAFGRFVGVRVGVAH